MSARGSPRSRNAVGCVAPEFALTPANATQLARLGLAFLSLPLSPSSMDTTFSYDLLTALPRISMPTLLVSSPHDSLSKFHARALGLLPQGREHVFSGVNPLQCVSRPALIGEYATVLRRFFRTAS